MRFHAGIPTAEASNVLLPSTWFLWYVPAQIDEAEKRVDWLLVVFARMDCQKKEEYYAPRHQHSMVTVLLMTTKTLHIEEDFPTMAILVPRLLRSKEKPSVDRQQDGGWITSRVPFKSSGDSNLLPPDAFASL
jgi:hypothetical protein